MPTDLNPEEQTPEAVKLDALRADIAAGLAGPFEPLDADAIKAEGRRRKAAAAEVLSPVSPTDTR